MDAKYTIIARNIFIPRLTVLSLVFWAAIGLLSIGSLPAAAEWELDAAHSAAHFSIDHMMVTKVRGTFADLGGEVDLNESGMAGSSFSIQIGVDSVDTGVSKRDDHLKSADFFDAEKFPHILFESKSLEKDGEAWKISGDLTLRGVTKPVEFRLTGLDSSYEDPWGNIRRGGQVQGRINRTDFGITYNKPLKNGGLMIGEEVDITADIQLKKAK